MTRRRASTFVILDSKSERGIRWTRITGGCVFEAAPAHDGFYHLPLSQFDNPTLVAICNELASSQRGTPREVRAYFERLGFIPLREDEDATFGADLRMLV